MVKLQQFVGENRGVPNVEETIGMKNVKMSCGIKVLQLWRTTHRHIVAVKQDRKQQK